MAARSETPMRRAPRRAACSRCRSSGALQEGDGPERTAAPLCGLPARCHHASPARCGRQARAAALGQPVETLPAFVGSAGLRKLLGRAERDDRCPGRAAHAAVLLFERLAARQAYILGIRWPPDAASCGGDSSDAGVPEPALTVRRNGNVGSFSMARHSRGSSAAFARSVLLTGLLAATAANAAQVEVLACAPCSGDTIAASQIHDNCGRRAVRGAMPAPRGRAASHRCGRASATRPERSRLFDNAAGHRDPRRPRRSRRIPRRLP